MPELLDHRRWEGERGPRILVEAAEWGARATIESELQAAGYRTLSCAGPEGTGRRCPLAADQGCGAAEDADAVVYALRTTDARNLEVLRSLRRRLPDTPVVIEAPAPAVARHPEEFAGCTVVDPPLTQPGLLTAVATALARAQPAAASPDGAVSRRRAPS